MLLRYNQIYFSGASSKKSAQLACLFDHIMAVAVVVLILVFYWGVVVLQKQYSASYLYKEHKVLEFVWTVLPMLLLLWVAVPSLYLLYKHGETPQLVFLTVKVVGHQWYWEYEINSWDILGDQTFSFDSYMTPNSELGFGFPQLLDVDKPLVLPYGVPIRILTTSADVIHSWALPSLGVKADALPGRMNEVIITALKPGIEVGMCSEICGDKHAHMPIQVEFISPSDFTAWLKEVAQRMKMSG
uniref:cytochrome c oxidase subunit II n=1 Tax=Nipponacmea moskalevi TaxID=1357978 RepID=UPI00286CF470|nr:cytochrome c oxidase subunit II [Nipponacmea moskalevi]WKR34936.1 cytochrome c oxidase subunit 2 [Nipponacmea moskalevi]